MIVQNAISEIGPLLGSVEPPFSFDIPRMGVGGLAEPIWKSDPFWVQLGPRIQVMPSRPSADKETSSQTITSSCYSSTIAPVFRSAFLLSTALTSWSVLELAI